MFVCLSVFFCLFGVGWFAFVCLFVFLLFACLFVCFFFSYVSFFVKLCLFLGCFIDLFFLYFNYLVHGFFNSSLFHWFVLIYDILSQLLSD